MSIANLTRYTIDYVPDSCDGDYVQHNVSKDGEYVKFEEAMEASSNSLQQLNVAITLLNDMVKVWNVYGVIHKDSWYYERASAVIAQQATV